MVLFYLKGTFVTFKIKTATCWLNHITGRVVANIPNYNPVLSLNLFFGIKSFHFHCFNCYRQTLFQNFGKLFNPSYR